MKISTRGRYALRLMLDIAVNDQGEPIRIRDIAARQEISVKYLEQIVSILTKAGYLKSIRGPQGGYRLARKPEEYTVGMILRLTEGDLSPAACADKDYDCPKIGDCPSVRIWREIDEAVNQVIDKYTLADMLEWQKNSDNNIVI